MSRRLVITESRSMKPNDSSQAAKAPIKESLIGIVKVAVASAALSYAIKACGSHFRVWKPSHRPGASSRVSWTAAHLIAMTAAIGCQGRAICLTRGFSQPSQKGVRAMQGAGCLIVGSYLSEAIVTSDMSPPVIFHHLATAALTAWLWRNTGSETELGRRFHALGTVWMCQATFEYFTYVALASRELGATSLTLSRTYGLAFMVATVLKPISVFVLAQTWIKRISSLVGPAMNVQFCCLLVTLACKQFMTLQALQGFARRHRALSRI